MLELKTSSKLGIGAIALAVMLGVFLWMRPKTAEPGRLPAVASPARREVPGIRTSTSSLGQPVERATSLVPLEDGSFAAGMTSADHEKLKSGQPVDVKVGEGSVTFSTKPLEKKP
jgi:hypothetical protein